MLLCLLFLAAACICFIGAFTASTGIALSIILLFSSAVLCVVGLVIIAEILLEWSFSCVPIVIDENGISRGLFRKESFRWDEVSQFEVALEKPMKNHPLGPRAEFDVRSIYLVFRLPEETLVSNWEVSRLGAQLFWTKSKGVPASVLERILVYSNREFKKKMFEYTQGVYFPQYFIAMKYTPQRFSVISSYMRKAGSTAADIR